MGIRGIYWGYLIMEENIPERETPEVKNILRFIRHDDDFIGLVSYAVAKLEFVRLEEELDKNPKTDSVKKKLKEHKIALHKLSTIDNYRIKAKTALQGYLEDKGETQGCKFLTKHPLHPKSIAVSWAKMIILGIVSYIAFFAVIQVAKRPTFEPAAKEVIRSMLVAISLNDGLENKK